MCGSTKKWLQQQLPPPSPNISASPLWITPYAWLPSPDKVCTRNRKLAFNASSNLNNGSLSVRICAQRQVNRPATGHQRCCVCVCVYAMCAIETIAAICNSKYAQHFYKLPAITTWLYWLHSRSSRQLFFRAQYLLYVVTVAAAVAALVAGMFASEIRALVKANSSTSQLLGHATQAIGCADPGL